MHENCVFFPNARCNMPNSSLFQHVVFQTPSIWRKTIPEHLRMDDACRMHNLSKTFSNADFDESWPYCVGTICPHNLSRCCSFTHLDAMTSLNLLPLLPLLPHKTCFRSVNACPISPSHLDKQLHLCALRTCIWMFMKHTVVVLIQHMIDFIVQNPCETKIKENNGQI